VHPNPVFHDATAERNIAFARARAFGLLVVAAPDGPLISHIPFLLSDDAATADLHLVRSNPIARMGAGPHEASLDLTAMYRLTGTGSRIRCPHGTMLLHT
jgi:transcriptional regulator